MPVERLLAIARLLRAAALLAGERGRWALAGDQLYADLDLSIDNLPPGAVLSAGTARIEVTGTPHLGCRKFSARFGAEALRFDPVLHSGPGLRLAGGLVSDLRARAYRHSRSARPLARA